MTRRLFASGLLIGLLAVAAMGVAASTARTTQADHEIDALVASIGTLEGATFLRNGDAHTVTEAVSHLQMKRRKAGARIKSAEDFITYCATGSSISGKPYRIRLADGTEVASADFLRARLRELRAAAPPPSR